MSIATNRDAAEAFPVDRSAAATAPLLVQLRRWLTEAWTERKQRRMERLVLEIGHPGVIAEMRRARERHDEFASRS